MIGVSMHFHAKHLASVTHSGPIVIRAISVAYWILAIGTAAFISSYFSLGSLFFLFIYQVLFYLAFIWSVSSLRRFSHSGTFRHSAGQIALLVICLSVVAAIILEGATVIGTPGSDVLSLECWSKKRLIIFIPIGYLLTAGVFLCYARRKSNCRPSRTLSARNIRRNVPPLFLLVLIALLISLVSCNAIDTPLLPIFGLLAAVFISAYAIVLFRRFHSITLETLFALIAFLFGSYLCIVLPTTTGISWDDQIHFKNATQVSYIINGKMTPTEVYFSEIAQRRALGEDVLSLSDWTGRTTELCSQELDDRYESDLAAGVVAYEGSDSFILTRTALGYLPMAAGLWLGRLLHVPFSLLVVMGRLGNLFTYILLFYFAIKVTPTKKLVLLVIGLLPSNIFLASNYSYDPWIIAFVACGCALLIREAWGDSPSLNPRTIVLSLTLVSVGIMIKAVYCPILGLFFLMPRQKFSSRRQRLLYFTGIIFLGLFLLSTFATPFVSSGGEGMTDSRGGSDVSSSGQFAYILSNPIEYIELLFEFFLNEYLNPIRMYFILDFGYLGRFGAEASSHVEQSLIHLIQITYILLPGLLEGNRASRSSASILSTLWAMFVSLLAVILVTTSIYITITPVGADTVSFWQYRYHIPLLVPFVAFACNNRTISGRFQRSRQKWEVAFPVISTAILVVCVVRFVTLNFI